MFALMNMQSLFSEMQPVSKAYLFISVVVTLAEYFKLLSIWQLYFDVSLIFRQYQLYRLFTHFFYFGSLGYYTILIILIVVYYLKQLENGYFYKKPADFALFIIVVMLLQDSPFMSSHILTTYMYVYGRKNPNQNVLVMGLVSLKSAYLPYVLLLINFMIDKNSFFIELSGIIVGHIYYFFKEIFPKIPFGFDLLSLPNWM